MFGFLCHIFCQETELVDVDLYHFNDSLKKSDSEAILSLFYFYRETELVDTDLAHI